MDWVKLFTLLVALLSVVIITQGTVRKKIRIHLPQKVKHIHHHKKIYITNHPASSQYAPGYLPTAEGDVAMPTTVAEIVPLKSMKLFDDRQPPLQGPSPAGSKLLPLYRARGYYGPSPEWEEQEYDLVPPAEGSIATAAVLPTAFSSPAEPIASGNSYPPKRVKVVKINESPRKKKVIRKRKPPKRIIIQDNMSHEEERPLTMYHEHFYSDLEGAGTIKKIKKPKRVEKVIDGDTEHIHTYSEEHIHKLVFDDPPKLTGVSGLDPAVLANTHPLIPIKNSQSLLAIDHSDLASGVGSFGNPSHLEYAAYNPRDVTHDHIFHDHGELPPHLDHETLARPPKVSYNSQGLRINGPNNKSRPKHKWRPVKSTKSPRPIPSVDLSYYEDIYSPSPKKRKPRPSSSSSSFFDDSSSSEPGPDDYRPIPSFKHKEKSKPKDHYFPRLTKSNPYRLGQESVPVPFTTPTSLSQSNKDSFQGFKPVSLGFANFKDPFSSFKDGYRNNYEFDTYASPSNNFNKENPVPSPTTWPVRGNKKSISTQNINFGGQDHKTIVDHLADSSDTKTSKEVTTNTQQSVKAFEIFNIEKTEESYSPSMEYTITENSPAHNYYSQMALKAFHDDPMSVPEASNTNFQFVEAPSLQTTAEVPATPISTTETFYSQPLESTTTAETLNTTKMGRRLRTRGKPKINLQSKQEIINNNEELDRYRKPSEQDRLHNFEQEYQRSRRQRNFDRNRHVLDQQSQSAVSQFKYGDKL